MAASLLALPDDLLIRIVCDVNNVWDIPAIALTCKRLAGLVYGDDQALWRQFHLEAYDNPFQAAAFLEPRSSYPWREVIIERNVVARYLQTGALTKFTSSGLLRHLAQNIGLVFYPKPKNEADADYVFAMEEVLRWAPRIFRVAYGLLVDMPPQGQSSRNEELFATMAHAQPFVMAMEAALPIRLQLDDQGMEILPGPLNGDRASNRLAAMALALGMDHPVRLYREIPTRRNWRRPMGGLVDWDECLRTSWFGKWADVDSIQGNPLLHLQRGRPTTSDVCDGTVWDWAGVAGEWLTIHVCRWEGARRPPAVLSPTMLDMLSPMYYQPRPPGNAFPASFQAVPVSSRAAVSAAFKAVCSESVDLWHPFPSEPSPRSGVPPLYFHSTDPSSSFVYGMVCLTLDEPPELEWIFGVWHLCLSQTLDASAEADESSKGQVKREDFVMRGVQLSGPLSHLGVRGSYGPRSFGPRGQLHSSFRDITWDPKLVSPTSDEDAFHSYGPAQFVNTAWLPPDDVVSFREMAEGLSSMTDADVEEGFETSNPQFRFRECGRPSVADSLIHNWTLGQVTDAPWCPSEQEVWTRLR